MPKKTFKRRPRGTGTYYKLSGDRRKPWIATVTVGYDTETGRQIQKPIGYFESDIEALNALSLYQLRKSELLPMNQSEPMDISKAKSPTFQNIWEKLLENELSHLSERSLSNYKVSFNHFTNLHTRKISEVTLFDMQPYFNDLMNKGTGVSKMNHMKIVLNYIFKYAMKYDYVQKNYAELITFRDMLEVKKTKRAFTEDEIKKLICDGSEAAESILTLIYTGMRPSELLLLKKENVHLNERYMIGGIKTKAGINRIIPIHEAIAPYIEKMISRSNCAYLFTIDGRERSYNNYLLSVFNPLIKKLEIDCTPHCGRHTFSTLANRYGMDPYITKLIMGHSSKDLTLDVYTHKDKTELIKEVCKIPFF